MEEAKRKKHKKRESYEETELERKGFKQIKTDTQKTETHLEKKKADTQRDR